MSDENCLDHLLSRKPVLVADGAMGTTLFTLGLEGGGCPELLNLDEPQLIAKVHAGFVGAGSDIILTNTFGGNRRRLALHGLQHRVAELNQAAVEIARSVADHSEREVLVAGSVGPTGDLFEPLGPISYERGVEIFTEQCQALAEAGADVLWIETISSFEELDAATSAAAGFGLPFVATLSFDTAGRTMMGISPTAVGEWWRGRTPAPGAIGGNCGIGPGDAVAAAFDITAVAPSAVVIAKANCGIPLYEIDRLAYPIGPNGMADYVELAIRSGAAIIGTCCGSTPDHIVAIRLAVDSHPGGSRPDRSEIEQRLEAHPLAGAAPRREGRRRG